MRFLFTIILAFLYLNCSFAQTCLPNGIAFYSQAEIDNFPTDYPGCTEILGGLTIVGDSNGLILMANSSLLNLDGLSSINAVFNGLVILENALLNDITGLSGVTIQNSGALVIITGNPNLSFCSLPNLCSYFLDPMGIIDDRLRCISPHQELLFLRYQPKSNTGCR